MPWMAGPKSVWLKTARTLFGRVWVQVWSLLGSVAREVLSVHIFLVVLRVLWGSATDEKRYRPSGKVACSSRG